MSSSLIISVSGLRGVVGSALNAEVAARYAAAFSAAAPEGPVVLARDGRVSGPMLRDAIAAALVGCGRTVLDADVAATPTVGVLVRAHQAAGAIQISASHNPPAYNGIKLFGNDGRVLTAGAGAAVKDRFLHQNYAWRGVDQLGHVQRLVDPHADHLQAVLATVDVQRIRNKQFRVLLDSNRGAGSLLGKRLLNELGCEINLLGATPDGKFEHPPEPLADNLRQVGDQVRQVGAVVGFCQDPDADRLALIDANGNYIGEEFTVALCVQHQLSQRKGPVVINCATSGMTEHLCRQAGVPLFRSAVGEANVADEMLRQQAIYGGEGNGGPIDPRVGLVRDSFVGMAQILDLLAITGKDLATLAAALPPLQIVKSKVDLSAEVLNQKLDALTAAFPEASPSRPDGLRLTWPDGRWLIVRGSNTEPIVRLIAEASTTEAAQALCDRAARVLA